MGSYGYLSYLPVTMKLLIVLSVLAVAAAIPYRPPCGVLRPPIVGPGGLPPPDIQDPIVGPGVIYRPIGGGIKGPSISHPGIDRPPIYGPGGIYNPDGGVKGPSISHPGFCAPRIIPVRRPCGYRPVRFCRRPVRYCRPIRRIRRPGCFRRRRPIRYC